MIPEARCIVCGCPAADHVALRYPLRAWLRHKLTGFTHRIFNHPKRT
ncbi:hypothetical protein [Mycobacterium xenopi]|uniref:Uncharacterized protein n=1 Tax=Mycobacterium xenopi TaxID=1789 RepID=A0AAD1M0T3_MYCXE|nr:hypothetical protein [Mycobacterium xenopi]EUA18499.1 hypothetical protein I552_9726 [Mycobacterium xenopi 3993]BBU22177.1 hypothetical protein MYXE_19670 [Mycobacterium xenopi]SPX78063.1 Uncharacterised protein [Mycobacterium xenopi]